MPSMSPVSRVRLRRQRYPHLPIFWSPDHLFFGSHYHLVHQQRQHPSPQRHKLVKAWLLEHQQNIECFFLPSYSPELNPVELANASLKHAVTTHAPARKRGQMEKVASAHLRHLQQTPKAVLGFFEKDTTRYAA